MSNIFILNGAQPYPFAPGALNEAFATRTEVVLKALGHDLRLTKVAEGYDVEEEIANHQIELTVAIDVHVTEHRAADVQVGSDRVEVR